MVNYLKLYNNIQTCKDFISISDNPEYDALEFQKQTTSWNYSSNPFTYLGNISGSWSYKIPDSNKRVGYCAA